MKGCLIMVTVKVSDLLIMANELTKDGVEYVDIEEYDSDEESPKCLHFEAYDGFGGGIDFEDIEHIEVSVDYKIEMGLES
jgi:hypothetical protein